jgi:hypothetical protein
VRHFRGKRKPIFIIIGMENSEKVSVTRVFKGITVEKGRRDTQLGLDRPFKYHDAPP